MRAFIIAAATIATLIAATASSAFAGETLDSAIVRLTADEWRFSMKTDLAIVDGKVTFREPSGYEYVPGVGNIFDEALAIAASQKEPGILPGDSCKLREHAHASGGRLVIIDCHNGASIVALGGGMVNFVGGSRNGVTERNGILHADYVKGGVRRGELDVIVIPAPMAK